MPTSSIFHNIVITDSKKTEAFVNAIERSIADPYKRDPNVPVAKIESDPEKLRGILDAWERSMEKEQSIGSSA